VADLPEGMVTFLFTDIEGSTRLWERFPDVMSSVIARHDALMRDVISANDGIVFKMVGDAVCAAFARPTDALAATIAAQRRLATEEWGETGPVRVRMALHTGQAELRDGDYFGQPLNRVARVLSAGHGGQVLVSRPVADLVRDRLPDGVALRDMGEHQLKDLQHPESILQVMAEGLASDFPALKTLDHHPHNLPLQPTSLIGRERELGEAPLLAGDSDVRLATLTGPGGMGKTRLALHAAAEVVDTFEDGVFFVPLATVTDPDLVAPTIAHTLGVRESGGQSLLQTLKEYLTGKHMLLVLDNFEQVIPAAPLVTDLLAHCPRLKILVTSRLRLNLRGEREFPLPPLGLPPPGLPLDAEQALTYPAIQLFVARAEAASSAFALTDGNVADVVDICRRLDGWPLAIELAAARARLLNPRAMLARLSRRLDLLTGGQRDLPDRHQALRATIDWSYDLLSPDQQALFRRLSVFSGGWSLEAAEAVAGTDSFDVLDDLMSLIDHSLVRRTDASDEDEPRFGMLESIAAHGAEQLDLHGEVAEIHDRHAAFFTELATEASRFLDRAGQDRWLDQLDLEHDNLREALRWYEQHDALEGLRLVGLLWPFWRARGYLTEGRAHLDTLLALPDAQSPSVERVNALAGAAMLAQRQDDYAAATARSEQAMAVLDTLGERHGKAVPLICLGTVAYKQRDFERAASCYEQSLTIAQETGDEPSTVIATRNLAMVALMQGNVEQATSMLEQSLALARRLGDRSNVAAALGNLGFISLQMGRLDEAEASFREVLSLARQMRDKLWTSMSLLNLTVIASDQGHHAQAIQHSLESLAICRELGNRLNAISCLEEIAFNLSSLDRRQDAARILGATSRLRVDHDAPLMEVERAEHEPRIASIRASLGDDPFNRLWSLGQSMSLDDATAFALAIKTETQAIV
jgi:predicted ATPase/class 3 adenylate cyclase/Tfp pilus assembly protein PilF